MPNRFSAERDRLIEQAQGIPHTAFAGPGEEVKLRSSMGCHPDPPHGADGR